MGRQDIKKIFKISLLFLFVLIVGGYATFASHDFFKGPEIIIYEPQNGQSFATSSILIRGLVKRSQEISLNDKMITIDDQGNFQEHTLLFPGYNVITLKARDKFDDFKTYRLELLYKVDY